MTAGPLELLDALLTAGETRIAALAVGGRHSPAASTLIGAGLLAPDGVVASTTCDACEQFHLVEVFFDDERGRYGWLCPDAGFVDADDDSVAAFSLGLQQSAAALARGFSAHYGTMRWTTRSLERDEAWLVGAWEIEGAWTTVALVRCIEMTSAARKIRRMIAELPPNDAGLVLTIGGGGGFEPPPRFHAIPLTIAVLLNANGMLSIDIKMLARILAGVKGGSSLAGRPPVEQQVFSVLERMKALGQLQAGGLAPAVGRRWHVYYPDSPCPKPPTLRKHVKAWRSDPKQSGGER